MRKTYKDFLENLGARESGGNYHAKNYAGYLGKYQMGEEAMVDAGYYKKSKNLGNNDWTGQFTGKDGVYSKEDFLNNPQAQENAQKKFKEKQWGYIDKLASKYEGKKINGIIMTQSGMLAGTHLLGQGKLKTYLESNGKIIPKDGNHVSIEDYMRKFRGYDISELTGRRPVTNYEYEGRMESLDSVLNQGITKLKSSPTGYAAPLSDASSNPAGTYTGEMIGKMSPSEFNEHESAIMQSIKDGTFGGSQSNKNYAGYSNPISGNNRIFTQEDIGALTTEEYSKYEPEINAQLKSIGIPTQVEMQNTLNVGGAGYVSGYTRSDGTEVRGYYRSR